MNRVKITVLKRTTTGDLFAQYAGSELSERCDHHEEGQIYYIDEGWQKPAGFCHEAWSAIHHYAFALVHGGKDVNFFDGWINRPGVAICSCNDGLRPVIFKLEAENE